MPRGDHLTKVEGESSSSGARACARGQASRGGLVSRRLWLTSVERAGGEGGGRSWSRSWPRRSLLGRYGQGEVEVEVGEEGEATTQKEGVGG